MEREPLQSQGLVVRLIYSHLEKKPHGQALVDDGIRVSRLRSPRWKLCMRHLMMNACPKNARQGGERVGFEKVLSSDDRCRTSRWVKEPPLWRTPFMNLGEPLFTQQRQCRTMHNIASWGTCSLFHHNLWRKPDMFRYISYKDVRWHCQRNDRAALIWISRYPPTKSVIYRVPRRISTRHSYLKEVALDLYPASRILSDNFLLLVVSLYGHGNCLCAAPLLSISVRHQLRCTTSHVLKCTLLNSSSSKIRFALNSYSNVGAFRIAS